MDMSTVLVSRQETPGEFTVTVDGKMEGFMGKP